LSRLAQAQGSTNEIGVNTKDGNNEIGGANTVGWQQ